MIIGGDAIYHEPRQYRPALYYSPLLSNLFFFFAAESFRFSWLVVFVATDSIDKRPGRSDPFTPFWLWLSARAPARAFYWVVALFLAFSFHPPPLGSRFHFHPPPCTVVQPPRPHTYHNNTTHNFCSELLATPGPSHDGTTDVSLTFPVVVISGTHSFTHE